MTKRHHQVHPPSSVSPNLAINKKPNYVPAPSRPAPVQAAATNKLVKAVARRDDGDDDSDELPDLVIS